MFCETCHTSVLYWSSNWWFSYLPFALRRWGRERRGEKLLNFLTTRMNVSLADQTWSTFDRKGEFPRQTETYGIIIYKLLSYDISSQAAGLNIHTKAFPPWTNMNWPNLIYARFKHLASCLMIVVFWSGQICVCVCVYVCIKYIHVFTYMYIFSSSLKNEIAYIQQWNAFVLN